MTEREPPKWETDSLSKYFADAEFNERVTAINYPDVFDDRLKRHCETYLYIHSEHRSRGVELTDR